MLYMEGGQEREKYEKGQTDRQTDRILFFTFIILILGNCQYVKQSSGQRTYLDIRSSKRKFMCQFLISNARPMPSSTGLQDDEKYI